MYIYVSKYVDVCWLLPSNQRFYGQIASYWRGVGYADDERGHGPTKEL